ncbi:unnamed protein product [Notodromas monacha]|uniref:F5/8 type C domain-containing protein n=1 Tax=Notodromas monacha TaxID=399045 RepID=A0A7R9BQQ8_9CRUS|nr:unnamed protein product [Notodromas monacha]CAG0919903.1 unnamed protein product [Notodromas monacha]
MEHQIDKVLEFTVCRCSSSSPNYSPENIKIDNPRDQGSRWSSESNSPPQYLILKLDHPAIVKYIYFGKYEKNHVCNLKRFKVFGSLHPEDDMVELLEGTLRNDSMGENFPLKHTLNGSCFPCRYIKIMPLQSWGPCVNFSIWYLALRGVDNWDVVGPQMNFFQTCKERETVRLCLKFLRQRRYTDAYEALLHASKVELEHPFLSSWFQMFVEAGDFEGCEDMMQEAILDGMLDEYIAAQPHRVEWEPFIPLNKGCVTPGMRGGHQMSMDVEQQIIYLFGGWDGYQDLSDFWAFLISEQKWVCISRDTFLDGGPVARSCHKMCIDSVRKKLYLLGRYVECQSRTIENMKSDFYVYDLLEGTWEMLSDDTVFDGGPPLLFDHQVVFDSATATLFVCGGRASVLPLQGSVADPALIGLYSFNTETREWKELRKDSADPAPSPTRMRSRSGHSVVLHPVSRCLYIFGGQRNKQALNDMMVYSIDTDDLKMVYTGEEEGFLGPPVGLTQRATLDPELNEIFMLRGSSRGKDKGAGVASSVKSSLWLYSISRNVWSCVYSYDSCRHKTGKSVMAEPCPRYAHQLVYDHSTKTHFLFGGNPGSGCRQLRLDDFWFFKLLRITREQLVQKIQFEIRRQRFNELVRVDPIAGIGYLRTMIRTLVDESDADQVHELHRLAGFACDPETYLSLDDPERLKAVMNARLRVFDVISLYFPESQTQPRSSLSDFVVL